MFRDGPNKFILGNSGGLTVFDRTLAKAQEVVVRFQDSQIVHGGLLCVYLFETMPLAKASQAIERVLGDGRRETMAAGTVVAARLGKQLAVVIVALARENFLKRFAGAALLALKHPLAQAFAGDLTVEMHLKLRERLGERVALGRAVVVAVEDQADARFERGGGLANWCPG